MGGDGMIDIILTAVMLIISVILSATLEMKMAALERLIEMVPLFVLAFRLLYNQPRVYMYTLGMFNRNVKYTMSIKLDNCDIDKVFFNKICDSFKSIYDKQQTREIKRNEGRYLWNVYLELDATLIEVTYNDEQGTFNIEAKSKTKFKLFIDEVGKITDSINSNFSSCSFKYDEEFIDIKIEFKKKGLGRENPFLAKYFKSFNQAQMNIQYIATNESTVEINNKGVRIVSDNLNAIKKDLKKEMLLF